MSSILCDSTNDVVCRIAFAAIVQWLVTFKCQSAYIRIAVVVPPVGIITSGDLSMTYAPPTFANVT